METDFMTDNTPGGDLFVLHREDSSASSRQRSLHAVRRSLETQPRLLGSQDGGDQSSNYQVPSSPLLVIHPPPGSRLGSVVNESSAKVDSEEVNVMESRQEGFSSNLDPNSIPLRVIYSPSVSRSSSVGQSDRPSTVRSYDDDLGYGLRILTAEEDSAHARSFQAPSSIESNVYRRGRNNSTASNVESRAPPSPIARQSSILRRSSSPTGRLAFEESGHRDQIYAPAVFVAFPQTKWFRPVFTAKAMLAFVCCAVLGNLVYT